MSDTKLASLLERLVEPNFQLKSDVYLNKLLTHLEGTKQYDIILTDWLTKIITIWSAEKTSSPSVVAFVLNVVSALSKSEERFVALNSFDFYCKLFTVTKARDLNVSPVIKIGYIKILHSLLDHKSGLNLIFAHNYWEVVLNLVLANQTVFINRECKNFFFKILRVTIDNEELSLRLIERILQPIHENVVTTRILEIFEVDKKLLPSLKLIVEIFEDFTNLFLENAKYFEILHRFNKNAFLFNAALNILSVTKHEQILFYVGRILQIVGYFHSILELPPLYTDHQRDRIIVNLFQANLSQLFSDNVLKFCFEGLKMSSLFRSKYDELKIDNIYITDQLVLVQSMPMFLPIIKYCYNLRSIDDIDENDDLRNVYMQKMFKIAKQSTWRILVHWRNSYLDTDVDLFRTGVNCVSYVEKSLKYYTKEQGNNMFQTLVYSLKDLVLIMTEKPELFTALRDNPRFISSIFVTMGQLIDEFEITWRDSVESTCVMSLCFDFLSIPTWPSMIVVSALKLLKIAISHYMTPNMALLMDVASDSSMTLLGPFLYAKLHDFTWEVRDSALEVVHSIASVSHTTFTSLQKVLLDSELPDLIIKMSTDDEESFVRASAVKTLQQIVQIGEIWNKLFKENNFHKKICDILPKETEGIVRVEVAILIGIIYDCHPEILNDISDTMYHAASTDLHWEVKMKALEFWDNVIKHSLQNQGMIDGAFPEFTFSVQCRKIVNLTEVEIQKRLEKVLKELNELGVLAVLASVIQDDCDIQVIEVAVKITGKFFKLLRQYNVNAKTTSEPSTPQTPSSGFFSLSSPSPSVSCAPSYTPRTDISDEILDEIVNNSDTKLLANVYAPTNGPTRTTNNYIELKRSITVEQFLSLCSQDLESFVKEKIDWIKNIEDLDSLLDDMLNKYDDDINLMDCY